MDRELIVQIIYIYIQKSIMLHYKHFKPKNTEIVAKRGMQANKYILGVKFQIFDALKWRKLRLRSDLKNSVHKTWC